MFDRNSFELGDLEFPDEELARLELSAAEQAVLVLEAVGIQTVAFLRSLTSEMQPPVHGEHQVSFVTKEGESVEFTAYRGSQEQDRPAHPGGWADVTGDLARAYAWEVVREGLGARLIFTNHMEYAAALEARDGYFVLSGVTDPGGPVEKALLAVIKQLDLDWELTRA